MKWRVLVSAPYFVPVVDEWRERLAKEGVELILADVNERLEEEELILLLGDIDGMICGDDRVTEQVLDAAPKLKVISKWGTGIDSIDKEAANKRGIEVCRTRDAFSHPVADTVLGYMLCFARKLPWMDSDIRKGIWHKRPSVSLRECTLGVIGVGDCGKQVVHRAKAFGMRILGTDIVDIDADFIAETGIEMASLDELLAQSDFVSTNTDLNSTSFHIINADSLAKMKETAYLINAARGPLVDEPALVKALQDGVIAGAAMDVFEDEPLPAESPLRNIEECMMAPHNANSSPEAWQRIHQSTVENLLRVLKGA